MTPFSRILRTDWFGPLIIVILAVVVIRAFSPQFLSPLNIQVLLLAIAVNALIAYAQMMIIAIGQMNLSVGAIGGLAAISFAGMMEVWGIPAPLAAALALLIGLLCGFVNGVMIAVTGISAFVITLATLAIYKGINLGITEAQPFYGIPANVKAFGNGSLFNLIPLIALPTLVAAVGLWFLLFRLPAGRFILAVGGNEHAAQLSGIKVGRTITLAHAISGFLAAGAGILVVARVQVGQPSIGDDWLILSFAAPVIGGAILTGGHVSVAATTLGVVIVALITQALVLFNIDPFLVQVVMGGLILVAVGINRLRETRMQALKRSV
ncbi:ABC transporter permease [Xinfangfangia sp. D13-10-4-6]|uniref:ABC transporter permease n=1 Tax=Pseudogemmobacter hezensis TaxID=2737662 RepID=UPI001556D5BF|nr:ABC transporter permease [Pseudogemmobacter hezensis]NPD16502.1 ABC transporter permease [Pseudogemmobacter hezensis]